MGSVTAPRPIPDRIEAATGQRPDRWAGYTCPCQDNEPAMREDRGDFIWRGVAR